VSGVPSGLHESVLRRREAVAILHPDRHDRLAVEHGVARQDVVEIEQAVSAQTSWRTAP